MLPETGYADLWRVRVGSKTLDAPRKYCRTPLMVRFCTERKVGTDVQRVILRRAGKDVGTLVRPVNVARKLKCQLAY